MSWERVESFTITLDIDICKTDDGRYFWNSSNGDESQLTYWSIQDAADNARFVFGE